MFGKIINYTVKDNEVIIQFTKKAGYITFITPQIVNFHEEERSDFAINPTELYVPVEFKVSQNLFITIESKDLRINVHDNFKFDIYDSRKKPIVTHYHKDIAIEKEADMSVASKEGHTTRAAKKTTKNIRFSLKETEYIYGMGEQTGFLNKRSYKYRTWNTDNPHAHLESFDRLYKSIPVSYHLTKEHSFAWFFDNTYEINYDLGGTTPDCFEMSYDKGYLNLYFVTAPYMKNVISLYSQLTGKYPLPPKWSLGYQQSRWSYVNRDEVMEVINEYQKHNIPIDTIHLDIDYMDNYKVFTTDEKKFPKIKEMIAELASKGVKVVTIIDPGVKVEKGYDVYDQGIKNKYFATLDNEVYVNEVWPGDSVFPSFVSSEVRNWWGGNLKALADIGVEGIWNDMNEPASFKGPLPNDVVFSGDDKDYLHEEVHNVYAHHMAMATYDGWKKLTNKRPFIITRAAFSGTQKYSTVWTGDNQSLWIHLQMAVPQLINLSISGFSFCGTDVGGFGANCTKELLIRWVQLGAFSPLFRNHSAWGTRRQEPYQFDQQTIDIYRKFVNLRYELIPYFYDLFYEHSVEGTPVIRPLFMEYPEDKACLEINNQFLLGENIMVAPVLEQGIKKRLVYIPSGFWFDYFTKKEYKAGYHIVDTPLDHCPIFVKAGSIIPTYAVNSSVKEHDELILKVFPGDGIYCHYRDNGEDFAYLEGKYNLYVFDKQGNDIKYSTLFEGYEKYKKITIK